MKYSPRRVTYRSTLPFRRLRSPRFRTSWALACLMLVGFSVGSTESAWGQDESAPSDSDQSNFIESDSGERIETSSKTVDLTVLDGGQGATIISSMSDGSGDGTSEMFFSGSGMPMDIHSLPGLSMSTALDPLSLLSDPSVQKDLELVGDQLQQLTDLQKSFSGKIKETIGDISKDGFDPQRLQGIGDLLKRFRAEQRSQMENLLLPHQIDRLKQISVQRHLKNAGAANALASDTLAEALGITDDQKKRLKERSKVINEELKQKIAQLETDARTELLTELTAEQREKLKKMTGEKYNSNPNDWEEKWKSMMPRKPSRKSKAK